MAKRDHNFMGMIGSKFKDLDDNLAHWKKWWVDPGYAKGNTILQAAKNIMNNDYTHDAGYAEHLASIDKQYNKVGDATDNSVFASAN